MRYLLPFLLLAFNANAADISASGVTCATTAPISVVVGSGSNRIAWISLTEGSDALNGDVTALGNVAETEVFTYAETGPSPDQTHIIWIWNEAAIGTFSGSGVSGSEGGADNFWCSGVIDDVDQTAMGDWESTAYTAAAATLDVTTTSTASDYVLVTVLVNQNGRTIDDYDTLTDQGTGQGAARFGAGSGAGGDNTTTVTIDTSGEITLASLVFLNAAAASNTALLRRRRQ